MIPEIIYLVGVPITFIFLFYFTDINGWSQGGCGHAHRFVSIIFALSWPFILLFGITIYLIELIIPGFLPSPGVNEEANEE